jgi:hypothetical protein
MIDFIAGMFFVYLAVVFAVLGTTYYHSKRSNFPLTKQEWFWFTVDVIKWPLMFNKLIREEFPNA